MLQEQETAERFGYRPQDLSPGSKKKVVYQCPCCGVLKETRRSHYHEGICCHSCSARKVVEQNRSVDAGRLALARARAAYAASGMTVRGHAFVSDRDERLYNRERVRRYRRTPLGNIRHRLRAALRRALSGIRVADLPYTPEELLDHIRHRLEARDYRCPMCDDSLKKCYDVDHVIPLAQAKTFEEILALFALENLDVLCPPCNRHRKRTRPVSY